MSYKLSNEELNTMVDDWTIAWRELVSSSEVSAGPLEYAPDDPI